MAIGVAYEAATGADIIPIVKYDAKAGRMFRRDRVNGESDVIDITRSFKAVFDFENLETGFIDFNTGSAPSFALAHIDSKVKVTSPPNPGHKPGARLLVKLGKECGGDMRELASTAKAFLRGLDAAHDAYLAGAAANPGKLPVFTLADSTPITSEGGGNKTTNYSPVFELVSWAPRPSDLTYVPRGNAPAASAPAAHAAPAAAAVPPSTGSTRVAAPAVDDGDDFG